MGCAASEPDINDHHHNIFKVVNVDNLGNIFAAVKLEVTDEELILHQRGKTPTRWPLQCVRKCGFNAEQFVFESRLHCPTGPGIYAFKCRRAEDLFNILKQHMQQQSLLPETNTASSVQFHSDGDGGMSGRPVSYPMCPQVSQLNSCPNPPYSNKIAALYEPTSRTDILYGNVHPDRHLYVNQQEDKRDTPIVTPRTSLVPPGAGCVAEGGGCPSLASVGCPSLAVAGMMRSNGGGALSGRCGSLASVTSGCGGSLVAVAGGCGPPGNGSGSSHSGATTDTDQQNSQINYIMVKVKVNSDSSVVVPASPHGLVTSGHQSPHHRTATQYTKIDFTKTNALYRTILQRQTELEDGRRKIRHNFSFNPAVLTRNNSSLSD